jgi:lipid-A-disaccharide synthase-like uncharacterized protein
VEEEGYSMMPIEIWIMFIGGGLVFLFSFMAKKK